jgi:hypothetical protein
MAVPTVRIAEWASPPAPNTGPWVALAGALRRHPGSWARLSGISDGNARATAQQIKAGAIVGFEPAGAFEAVSRVTGFRADGKRTIGLWARYTGGSNGQAAEPAADSASASH